MLDFAVTALPAPTIAPRALWRALVSSGL